MTDRKGRLLGVTTRTLMALGILLYLTERNSSHVSGFVRSILNAWGEAQTKNEMGAIMAALEAEYVSRHEYPGPESLTRFIRKWIRKTRRNDPAADYWGSDYQLTSDGPLFFLVSCGPDRECGTTDDLRRALGFPKEKP